MKLVAADRWPVRRLGILLLLATALAAAPASAREHETWVRHRAPGFSIQLPPSWYDASGQRDALFGALARLSSSDPNLVPFVQLMLAGGRANPAIKFIAFDVSRSSLGSGFATNLNVVRERTRATFAEWSRAAVRGLTEASFVEQPIWSRKVRLPAGRALRLTYRAKFKLGGRVIQVSIVQYGLVQDGMASVLTYSTLPAKAAGYRAVFDRSARSLRFL